MHANDRPRERTTGAVEMRLADGFDDATFAALAKRRRRIALRILARRSRSMAVADLAREIASREGGTDDGRAEDRVYHDLVHVHVPKLVEAGLIEHDREKNAVEGTAALESVHDALRSFERRLTAG